MASIGLWMAAIFAVIYFMYYPRLVKGVTVKDWPVAGAAMNRIRLLVATNLLLGAVTVTVALLGNVFG